MIEITKSSYELVCVFVPYLNMSWILQPTKTIKKQLICITSVMYVWICKYIGCLHDVIMHLCLSDRNTQVKMYTFKMKVRRTMWHIYVGGFLFQ